MKPAEIWDDFDYDDLGDLADVYAEMNGASPRAKPLDDLDRVRIEEAKAAQVVTVTTP